MPAPATTLRLLGIFAHPDDETLGVGGVFARYAAEGVATFLLTATRGQSGRYHGIPKDAPGHPGRDELARIREAELHAAAAVLGIGDVHLLDYVDGQLDQAPAREIAAHVRRVRPHVVVTFAPDGAYGHPDHIAISQFATAALVRAADPSFASPEPPHATAKQYYMALPQGAWDAYQEAFKTLTSTVDGVERRAVAWPEWEITTVIDTRDVWPTVWRAVQCYDSQVAAYEKLHGLSPEHHEGLWGRQCFYRAFSLVNGGRVRETDLFEGLRPR
jgi:LmbE family N-acetylglucosaminyl deacetylase